MKFFADAIAHRGPDGEGQFVEGNIGLGHRRLAIIDLSEAGVQPMHDPLTGLTIVFNGEIYNYRELRADLAGRGHAFRSNSDTEVLLKLYAEHGLELIDQAVDSCVHVIVVAFHENVLAAHMHAGLDFLLELVHRHDDVDVYYLIEVARDPAELCSDVFAYCRCDIEVVSAQVQVHCLLLCVEEPFRSSSSY